MNSNLIKTQYGGKKALLLHCREQIAFWFGKIKYVHPADWKKVHRIVFVCKGNICRSPYAEYKARLLGLPSDSFGLNADPSAGADHRAIEVALQRDVDLRQHQAVPYWNFTIQPGDLILAFERTQLNQLRRQICSKTDVFISLVGLWCTPPFPYIHDPYGLEMEYFERCYDRIDEAIERIRILFERVS